MHERWCRDQPQGQVVKTEDDDDKAVPKRPRADEVPLAPAAKKGKVAQEERDQDQEPIAEPMADSLPSPSGAGIGAETPSQSKTTERPKGRPRTKKEKEKRPRGRPRKKQEKQAAPDEAEAEGQDEEEETKVPECCSSSSIGGSCPTVYISGTHPPRWLLPSDAKICGMPRKKNVTAAAETHQTTTDAANVEGLVAPEAWPGLGELPPDLPADFRSLLVLGPSGSGKSTLLKVLLEKFFPDYQGPLYPCGQWPEGRALIENFNSAEQGRACLTSVGLSSVPSWCKPYEVLSVGERYRANLALALQQRETDPDKPLVFDEWTSELDRDLAKVVSVAFCKRMRREWTIEMPETPEVEKTESKEEIKEEIKEEAWQVKEEFLEQAWSLLMDDPCDVEMQNGAQEATEAEEKGEDWGEDWGEMGEEENCEVDPLVEENEKEGNDVAGESPLAEGGKDDTKKPEAPKVRPGGPYIFASCHEDILNYLQPQYVIFCESGAQPRLIKNPNEGKLLSLSSRLEGVTEPIRHHLVGSWMPGNKIFKPFMVTHKGAAQPNIFKVWFEGGERSDKLEKSGDWYTGKLVPSQKRIRFKVLGPKRLEMQREEGQSFGKIVKATRRRMLAAHQAFALVDDSDAFVREKKMLNYSDCGRDLLDSSGWFLPPEWGTDGLYKGLRRRGNPIVVRTMDFRYNAKLEQVDDRQRHLATYVGEVDGTLGAALQNVSKLLDLPFSGLCTHRLDTLKFNDFQLGVITGPSGSGKSTLARDKFGPSPKISWLPDQPVLAHFASLEIATDLLGAASLDLHTAMRPYDSLSGGEQARAHMARVLAIETSSVLILDEFTSMVDRPTAKRMAKGLQKLVKQGILTTKIVVVSCHSDFVGRSLLEPDWLFETNNHRLIHFEGADLSKAQKEKVEPLERKLQEATENATKAEKEVEAFKGHMLKHAGHSFFTPVYRNEVAAFAGALQVLSSQELAAQKREVEKLESELTQLRIEVTKIQEPEETDDEAVEVAPSSSIPLALRIPEIQLRVRRALPREWVHFREHHYKDKSLGNNSVVFVGEVGGGRACCFSAFMPESANWIQKAVKKGLPGWEKVDYPRPWLDQSHRRLFREHRTVVLPDFQGMGLATLMCDCLAVELQSMNFDYTSQSVHPFYGSYRDRSPFWRALPTSRSESSALKGNLKYSHVFIGAFRPDGTRDAELNARLRHRVKLSKNQSSVLLQKDIPELS